MTSNTTNDGWTAPVKALREALIELGQDVRRFDDAGLLSLALGRGDAPVPNWANKTAEERVAALREDYKRQGEDVTGLSDAELLNRALTQSLAESRRHENACTSLLQDQVKHDRSVYAAARREAAERQSALAGLYLNAAVRKAATPVTGLIYRISQLSDRPGPKVVEELKGAARQAEWTLDGVVRDKALAEIAESDPSVKLASAQAVEINRLREVIQAEGRRLHAGHGHRQVGPRCECTGCELIRAMDDVPAEQATPIPSAAPAA